MGMGKNLNSILVIFLGFLITGLLMADQEAFAQTPTFQKGDVIVSTSSGQATWFEPDGTLPKVIDCTDSGEGSTTGSAFDSAGNFYMTMFLDNQVCKTDNTGTRIGNFGSGYSTPEDILFDAAGNAYVGNLVGGGFILKFDSSGNQLDSFATGRVDFMDLSADQCTMFYGQEGNRILRYNVCTDTQLLDFTKDLLQVGEAFAMRILPDGGLLVADRFNVKRLDL